MSHMTQTANPVTLLASPLGEEGHEVAKGCTRVRMIMILDVDVTAERRHYNTHRLLKGKRGTWREKQASHILHVPFRCFPLWWLAPPPFPRSSVGRQKKSALMGRLGALLRPTWRSYAGPPQGTTTRAYCRARKCTPFGGWRHHLPPGGGTLFFAMR